MGGRSLPSPPHPVPADRVHVWLAVVNVQSKHHTRQWRRALERKKKCAGARRTGTRLINGAGGLKGRWLALALALPGVGGGKEHNKKKQQQQ